MMRPAIYPQLAIAVATVLATGGCSSPSETGRVSGTVTLDGAPLKVGQINFLPVDGASATAGGAIADGRFTVETPPGAKTVKISAPKVVGKQKMYDTADSPSVDIVEELLPARYNAQSELTFDVQPGEQEKQFALQSK